MLIIDDPAIYNGAEWSMKKTLASSVVVVATQKNTSMIAPMNIYLYFKILPRYKPNISATYFCSFYDTDNLRWSESGCSEPQYNNEYDRYECTCSHLTTFALLWSPNTSQSNYLTPQDIASFVFLSIPIVCFIGVIIHSLIIRLLNPMMSNKTYDLLPLISSGSTSILFIFYIALKVTVYTRTASENESQCFLSSSILMFITYFFLIFTFCIKISIIYFHYLRFIRLSTEPSYRKLFILVIISFIISIACVFVPAGLHINSSFNIIELYPYKLCWFNRNAIFYFITIPASIFLLLNTIIIIFAGNHGINHGEYAEKSYQSYKQMKQCISILSLSCVTQGVGWIFGSVILSVDPTIASVFGWIFLILNGLEGIWTILLYMIIQSERLDRQKHAHAHEEITNATVPLPE
jgi:hypothetical protein